MFRLGLRFFLILSLVFNGMAAPWAQAHMRHDGGGHAGHHAPAAVDAHAHHDMHDMSASTADEDDGGCCKGGACQCGCVLSPALPLPATLALLRHWTAAPADAAPALAMVDRDNPPFRPPAA